MSEAHPALSTYAQLRLTLTHEINGRVSVRLQHKGYQDDWRNSTTLAADSFWLHEPLDSPDGLRKVLSDWLGGVPLP